MQGLSKDLRAVAFSTTHTRKATECRLHFALQWLQRRISEKNREIKVFNRIVEVSKENQREVGDFNEKVERNRDFNNHCRQSRDFNRKVKTK